jgi:predicted transcriptional regulator
VLRILRRQPDATPEEVAEVLGADEEAVRSIIGELIDQGELEPQGGVELAQEEGKSTGALAASTLLSAAASPG